jgi:hypothetical protein
MPNPSSLSRSLLPWLCVLATGAALAAPVEKIQVNPPPTKLQYASALASYQGYTDQAVQSWREANDRVGRIGGWRAYAKEAATGQPAPDTPPAANPHAGHHEGGKQ